MTKYKPKLLRIPLYLDPTSDYGFHKLFGEQANKDLLIDFLVALNCLIRSKSGICNCLFSRKNRINSKPVLINGVFS